MNTVEPNLALQPGSLATWLHEPRGGYGFTYPVNAEVLRVTAKRVLIRVPLKAGGTAERWVTPERLKLRVEK